MRLPAIRRIALGAFAILALVGAACSSSDESTPTTSSSGPSMTIKSFNYSPQPLNAKVGDTITVTNDDGTDHTATADDASFDTGPFSTGSKTFNVSRAGAIAFHCDIHDFMKGVIEVTDS